MGLKQVLGMKKKCFVASLVLACIICSLAACKPEQKQVVSLVIGSGSGNAVVLEKEEENYVLCTAAHVVGQEPKVAVVDGMQVTVEEYYISPNVDLAFLKVPIEETEQPYQVTGMDTASFNELSEGDGITIYGFWGGQEKRCKGSVLSCWIYMEDFGYHMLWAKASDVKNGMSGCGVFDQQGGFIGILCGGDGKEEVAVLPVSMIEAEWKNSGYGGR